MLYVDQANKIRKDIAKLKDESANFRIKISDEDIKLLSKIFYEIEYDAGIISANLERIYDYRKTFAETNIKE